MSNDVFDQLPLFEGINPAQRVLLRQIFTPVDCYANTLLFEQGDPAEFLYLVVVGEVIVNFKPDDGPAITVAQSPAWRRGRMVRGAWQPGLYFSCRMPDLYPDAARARNRPAEIV